MSLIAKGKFVILTLIEKCQCSPLPGKIITLDKNNDTPTYQIHHTGNSSNFSKGDVVLLNSYAQPIDIDGKKYYIVSEDGIAAVIE